MKRQTTKQSNNRNKTIKPFKELLLDLEVGMPNIIDVWLLLDTKEKPQSDGSGASPIHPKGPAF